jgi:hypothetical protein
LRQAPPNPLSFATRVAFPRGLRKPAIAASVQEPDR